jgi:dTMP kinase
MKRGKFITLEGCEGVGKSTNLSFMYDCLRDRGIDAVVTREPGGTPLAEEIRAMVLNKRDEAVDAMAELLLIFAARSQHLNTVILPALNAGRWVLCDRFTDATYAYQGTGRNLSAATVAQLENLVQGKLRPDLTILLDIDIDLGLQRASERGELDRFESEPRHFFETVRAAYLQRARQDPQRFAIVDAAPVLTQVQNDIRLHLEQLVHDDRIHGDRIDGD